MSLPEDIITRLVNNQLGYTELTIPAGTYLNQSADIKTVGVTAVLVAKNTFSKDLEATILEALKAHNLEIQKISFGKPIENAKHSTGIFSISFNMYLTLAIAVLVLYLGVYLQNIPEVKYDDIEDDIDQEEDGNYINYTSAIPEIHLKPKK